MDMDSQDIYVARLHTEFTSCDTSGTGFLGRTELDTLCHKLQLGDQANYILEHLLGDSPNSRVDFDEFKEKFVSLLAQYVENDQQLEEETPISYSSPEREVSPKMWGGKKYGRRSRPEMNSVDTDDDVPSDFSEMKVFASNPSPCHGDDNERSLHAQNEASSPHPHAKRLKRTINSDVQHSRCAEMFDAEVDNSLPSNSEDNEDYLRATWRKLGVGFDGFLDQEELCRVCEHIGMEMSEEVVSQLFEKLDVDQDGRISFEEFFHLFKSGDASVASCGSSSNTEVGEMTLLGVCKGSADGARKASLRDGIQAPPRTSEIFESGIFSSIDPENAGYAEPDAVVALWANLGITGGYQILKELGFNTMCQVRLLDLTSALEDVMQSSTENYLRRVSFCSFQHELQFLRKALQHVSGERDKLKTGLVEANTRATLLAQEVDEHHANLEKTSANRIMFLEKKCMEQVRGLQEELRQEREHTNCQISQLKQSHEKELAFLKEEETRLREKLNAQQAENEQLENETREFAEKLLEAQKIGIQQQRELENMVVLKQKLDELESGQELLYEKQCKTLSEDLESYRVENKRLRDQNDELSTEIDALRQQVASKLNFNVPTAKTTFLEMATDNYEPVVSVRADDAANSNHRRNGSWLADYIKLPPNKRRGNGSPVNSSTEDNSEEESPRLGKVRRRVSGALSYDNSGLDSLESLPAEQSTGHGEQEAKCEDSKFATNFSSEESIAKPARREPQESTDVSLEIGRNDLMVPRLSGNRNVKVGYVSPQRIHYHKDDEVDCDEDAVSMKPTQVSEHAKREREFQIWGPMCEEEKDFLPQISVTDDNNESLKSKLEMGKKIWNQLYESKCRPLEDLVDDADCYSQSALQNGPSSWHYMQYNEDRCTRKEAWAGDTSAGWSDGLAHEDSKGEESDEENSTDDESTMFLNAWDTCSENGDRFSRRKWPKMRSKHKKDCCLNLQVFKNRLEVTERCRHKLQRELEFTQESLMVTQSLLSPHSLSRDRPERPLSAGRLRENGKCLMDIGVLNSVTQRLKHQEQRCQQLEGALRTQAKQSEKLARGISDVNSFYEDKLFCTEQMLDRTMCQLRQQALRFQEQDMKIARADYIIKNLCHKNAELAKALHNMEERAHTTEQLNHSLHDECRALNKLVFEVCQSTSTHCSNI